MTPSTAISFSFSSICQTSRPARRIFSSSAAVLRTIIGSPIAWQIFSNTRSGGSQLAIHFHHPPPGRAGRYSSTGRVCRSYASSRSRITVSLSSSRITSFSPSRSHMLIHFRRLGNQVVQRAAARTLPASRQAGNNTIVINGEINHHLAHSRARPASAHNSPACASVRGYPSKINPSAASGSAQPLLHHAVHQFVRHQRARLHRWPPLRPQFRALPNPLPQHIAGRDMGNTQAIASAASPACPSRTRRAEQ